MYFYLLPLKFDWDQNHLNLLEGATNQTETLSKNNIICFIKDGTPTVIIKWDRGRTMLNI